MARNRPSFPSMSLTSRTTKVSSRVSEQNARRRPPLGPPAPLPPPEPGGTPEPAGLPPREEHRLIRTSVKRMTHLRRSAGCRECLAHSAARRVSDGRRSIFQCRANCAGGGGDGSSVTPRRGEYPDNDERT